MVLVKMKETAEAYLGHAVTKAVSGVHVCVLFVCPFLLFSSFIFIPLCVCLCMSVWFLSFLLVSFLFCKVFLLLISCFECAIRGKKAVGRSGE